MWPWLGITVLIHFNLCGFMLKLLTVYYKKQKMECMIL